MKTSRLFQADGSTAGNGVPRVTTGNAGADIILGGGFPANSINVIMGSPGTGKTIFAQQLAFSNSDGSRPVLYLSTLSEPLAKIITYLQRLAFYDEAKVGRADLRAQADARAAGPGHAAPGGGKLSGGVAHEVNNMMTVVIGFSQDVLRDLPPDHPGRRDLEQVVLAANRAADITRQLLAFSRQQVLQPVPMRLQSLLQSLLPLLQRLVGAGKLLDFQPSAEPLWVVADRNQLEQVVVNLLANARDAVNAGGRITISTTQRRLDAEYTLSHHGVAARPGEYAAIIVTDTGSGMDAATLARVFEPFYTTKEMGRGTGLGLATVYGIVKQSDGYIWVYSEPGQGTTIKVYLPLADAGDTPGGPAALPRPERGRETILVVEDEPMVREMTCRNLAALGYTVLQAESGDAALAVVEQTPEIDLVLADVVMPGLSAKGRARRLAESDPDLPVLFMSGYLGDEVVRRDLLSPGVPFLEKPFGPQELSRAVRALLDQSLEQRSQPD